MRTRIGIMRFEEPVDRWEKGSLSHGEAAAAALGVSERTFRRWRHRFEDEGPEGLGDRRAGRPSPRRAPEDELARMPRLDHAHDAGVTVRHCHEKLVKRHGDKLGSTTTRLHLQQAGAVAPAPKRGVQRRKRPRRPMVGMRLHQDASPHAWLPGRPPLDPVITLDDATSALCSAFLVEEEGARSSFRGLAEVIARSGLFMALDTDRASHDFHTPQAGGKVSRTQRTQVGRALNQLGIEPIPASSPEARGRCERALRTLQDRRAHRWGSGPRRSGAAMHHDRPTDGRRDRRPKELALAGITTPEAANRFLREVYLPEHNARFAVAAAPTSAFVAVPAALWRDVLGVQEERRVGNDSGVRWHGRTLQIPPRPLRRHFVRAIVRVHEDPDGSVALFKGPQRLARFPPVGAGGRQGLAA